MFNRKKAIVSYSNNNKIKPSNPSTSSTPPPPVKGPITDTNLLELMRENQTISNYEYMSLALLRDILLKLNQIEVNTRSTAASNEFLGKYVLNKFKWF